jgi:hypothetical protein
MVFGKDQIGGFNKKHSEESKMKMSESHKGHTHPAWNKGMKWPEESKKKHSIILKEAYKNGTKVCWNKGKKFKHNKQFAKGQIPWNKNINSDELKLHYKNGFKGIYKKGNVPWMTGRNPALFYTDESRKKLRLKALQHIKNVCGGVVPFIGKHEKQIIDELETLYNCKIIRQYHITSLGFIVDGYIPEFNLIIEIDEKHHQTNANKDKDKIRQEQIEKELNCNFLRIKDKFQ